MHGGAGNDSFENRNQLAGFDITKQRWTTVDVKGPQSTRNPKMFGHSAEIWRDRFYTFFGVYEAPGGDTSYSNSVKYIDLTRPFDGWQEILKDQGDSNRLKGTPKSRYRQKTFLYKVLIQTLPLL